MFDKCPRILPTCTSTHPSRIVSFTEDHPPYHHHNENSVGQVTVKRNPEVVSRVPTVHVRFHPSSYKYSGPTSDLGSHLQEHRHTEPIQRIGEVRSQVTDNFVSITTTHLNVTSIISKLKFHGKFPRVMRFLYTYHLPFVERISNISLFFF